MKKPFSNKDAITPLMITLLLVSFAVAVAVVVMNLGQAQVEEEAQCPIEIGLTLASVGGNSQVCYDSATKQFRFTIENGVNVNVNSLQVNVIGTEGAQTVDLTEAKLSKAGNYFAKVAYDEAVNGPLKQVKIIPNVVLYDEEQVCVEQALVVEEFGSCV